MQDADLVVDDRDGSVAPVDTMDLDAGSPSRDGRATTPDLPDAGQATPSSPPGSPPSSAGFYRMERLDRGLVAVDTSDGVYLAWRLRGDEYDPQGGVAFDVYRDGARIATLERATNYLDPAGTPGSSYSVQAHIADAALPAEPALRLRQGFLRVPIEPPPPGRTPGAPTCETPDESYTYDANDASAADLDGDGDYELVLKWEPTNAKDNSQSGCTGNVYLDAYTLQGERLWRIDLGPNIRAGAHYTQFLAYDLDGDGRAELAVKTAPGTRDGTGQPLQLGPAADDDDQAEYRSIANASGRTGYILTGPEYLSVFDGLTGREQATVRFVPDRGRVADWGDNYGNRVDRFLAGIAYLDDTGLPSLVMARGYYTRTTLTAWNYRSGQLAMLWRFDSNDTPRDAAGKPFTGQGAHALSVANVDQDRPQEIIYGAMVVDHDGRGRCSTGFGHGDALHVGDFVPERPGLEVFMPHEDGSQPSFDIHDASSCEVIVAGPVTGGDTGRGVAADVSPSNPGAEMWVSGGKDLLSASRGARVGDLPRAINFLAFWDADAQRELVDKTSISKYGGGGLVSCSECSANNGTKATPALLADLFGDFREEVVWREADNRALRIYTTTIPTDAYLFTLMHDPQYRVAVAWQNVAYNQPPHPSFALAGGPPPAPDVSFAR